MKWGELVGQLPHSLFEEFRYQWEVELKEVYKVLCNLSSLSINCLVGNQLVQGASNNWIAFSQQVVEVGQCGKSRLGKTK